MSNQDIWNSQFGGNNSNPRSRRNSNSGNDYDMCVGTVNSVNSVNTANSQLMDNNGRHMKVDRHLSESINGNAVNNPNHNDAANDYAAPFAVPAANMHPNALMMMNSQSMMGGIIPLNLVMPPNFTLDTSKNIKTPKKRRRKDKNKPKRPLSAYNLFFKDEREKILNQIPRESDDNEVNDKITWPGKKRPPHGKISFEELAKTIGARWQNLDEETKSQYKKKADEDLERYATEMKLYDKRTKQQYKAPQPDESPEEDDTKRPREASKTSSTDTKRKKTRKPSKDAKDPTNKNMEFMKSAMQDNMGNMMAMNVAGNVMFPMIFPTSGQPMDKLDMLQAQQQILSDQIAQETERRRKLQQQQQQQQHQQHQQHQLQPHQQQGNVDMRKSNGYRIPQNHSFGKYQRYRPDNDDLHQINPSTLPPPPQYMMSASFDQGPPHYGMFQNYRKHFEGGSTNANTSPHSQHQQDLNDNFSSVHSNQNVNDFPFPPGPDDPFFDQTD